MGRKKGKKRQPEIRINGQQVTGFQSFSYSQPLPSPTFEQAAGQDEQFEAVYRAIKDWDVDVGDGACGGNGSHAAAICAELQRAGLPKPGPYQALRQVLRQAADQAEVGKGLDRHARPGERFEDQQIVQLGEWMGTIQFAAGQALKKTLEATRLASREGEGPARARAELLGAIVYLAAAVVQLDGGKA